MHRRHLTTLLTIALVLLSAVSARAQEPRGDFGISYSVLRDSSLGETFPAGLVLAIAGDINKVVRGVGEFSANYKTVPVGTARVRLQVLSYLGGLRIVGPVGPRRTVFVQVLAGGARLTGSIAGIAGSSSSDNAFAVQPGGGVDVQVNDTVGIRVQADYRAVRSGGSTTNEYRVAFGVVIPFGR